jgi:hypothetical protein
MFRVNVSAQTPAGWQTRFSRGASPCR